MEQIPLSDDKVVLFVGYTAAQITLHFRPVFQVFRLCRKPAFDIPNAATYAPDAQLDGPIFQAVLRVARQFGIGYMHVDEQTICMDRNDVDPRAFGNAVRDELGSADIACTNPELYDESAAPV